MALITSGSVSSHVRDIVASDDGLSDVAVYKIDMPFPANAEALQDIVDSHGKTLLIEETYPVLELHIRDRRKVSGRLSGHVPPQGELTPEVVEDIIFAAAGKPPATRQAPNVKPRRPSLCPGCPHRPAFYMIRQVFDKLCTRGTLDATHLGSIWGLWTRVCAWGLP